MSLSPPPYTYDPIPSKTHIHLIRLNAAEKQINLTLTAHDLASPSTLPPFTALSYTWGCPGLSSTSESYFAAYPEDQPPAASSDSIWGKATHPVRCNGSTFLVRLNLFDALIKPIVAEDNCEEMVSIDAICIDQDNIQEREDQVQLMGDIFGRAEGVLAWLGANDEFTDDAVSVMERLEKVGKVCNSEEEMSVTLFFLYLLFLKAIFEPRLTYRRELERQKYDWITSADLHEPEAYEKLGIEFTTPRNGGPGLDSVSRAVHFLEQVRAWGGSRITDKVLSDIFNPEDGSEPSPDGWDLALSLMSFGAQSHVALAVAGTRLHERAGLDALLEAHRDTNATDPRDKVYALLGLTSDPVGDLIVDYGSPVDVDLRIFAHREPNRNRKSKSLPSWVPEFSVKHEGGAMDNRTGGGKDWMASGGETWKPDDGLLDGRELQVRGRVLGFIESVYPRLLFRGKEEKRWQGWRDLLRVLQASLRPSEIQFQGFQQYDT
ncbi:Heterokaryon incompatibility protein (HET) domain containing protein [Rhypophila sp. PSN 637]